jgi:hypothetical protein
VTDTQTGCICRLRLVGAQWCESSSLRMSPSRCRRDGHGSIVPLWIASLSEVESELPLPVPVQPRVGVTVSACQEPVGGSGCLKRQSLKFTGKVQLELVPRLSCYWQCSASGSLWRLRSELELDRGLPVTRSSASWPWQSLGLLWDGGNSGPSTSRLVPLPVAGCFLLVLA